MLFVDVNLGNSGNKRIVVYEGDTAENLAESFSRQHGLDEAMNLLKLVRCWQQILRFHHQETDHGHREPDQGHQDPLL